MENQADKKDNLRTLGLFFFNPFLSFLYSLKFFYKPIFADYFCLLIIYYGFTFHIPSLEFDSYQYYLELKDYRYTEISFNDFLHNTFGGHGNLDLVIPFIIFILSKITDSSSILFGVFGCLFGIFWRNILKIILNEGISRSLFSMIILLSLLACVGMWNINGIRFWLTTLVFFNAILLLEFRSDRKGYYLLFLTPFFHFSFLLIIILYLVYRFLNRFISRNILLCIVILTNFLSFINIETISNLMIDYLPEFFSSKISVYTSVEYMQQVGDIILETNPLLLIHGYLLRIFNIGCFVFVLCNYEVRSLIPMRFLNFWGVLLVFAQVVVNIPSMGRFLFLTYLISLTIFLFTYQKFNIWLKYSLVFLLVLYTSGQLWIFRDFFTRKFFLSNPFLFFLDKIL